MPPKRRAFEHRAWLHEEILTLAMLAFLNGSVLLFADVRQVLWIFLGNLLLAGLILAVRRVHAVRHAPAIGGFRDWYCLGILITIYLEHRCLVPLVNPRDVDDLIIQADRFLFSGHDPTVLLERFVWPPATELLQVVYASFYFLPFLFALRLYLRGKRTVYHIAAATILSGFYVSFVGYYLTPAIGPRFTLTHLQEVPLTGVWSFAAVRGVLDAMGGITRDCCPSGHTLISVLTVLLARTHDRGYFRISLVWSILLLFSTVYLRYHYVLDVAAGLVLAAVIHRWVPGLVEKRLVEGRVERGRFAGKAVTWQDSA